MTLRGIKVGFFKTIAIIMLTSTLVACGGSGGGSSGTTPTVTTPSGTSITSGITGLVTVSGKATANTIIMITFPDGSVQETTTDSNGNYSLVSSAPQNSGLISISNFDDQGNSSAAASELFTADIESTEVLKALYKATGVMPELPFSPSLGINTEAPQGGVGSAGTPIAFVDIFRTARPFPELSGDDASFDENGWPMDVDPTVTVARTKLLQGARPNSIPDGQYTVLYDVADSNSVSLEFNQQGPVVTNTQKDSSKNKYTFDLALQDFDSDIDADAETNAVLMNIRGINPDNYVKNIRVIMPGGTCKDSTGIHNPYLRMESQADCPSGTTYESFESRLSTDRNTIIFNPDYLLFLRNFKLVRMMNLMEASLKDLCGNEETTCPDNVGTWSHQATIDDSVWGGDDGRTAPEDHKGVPIEVMVALANTLKKDIWINIPHIATDDYISNYAQQIFNTLDPSIKVYLEYSNEVWNSGFAGYQHTTQEGLKIDGFDDVPTAYTSLFDNRTTNFKSRCDAMPTSTPEEIQKKNSARCEHYFARLRFFSKRSVEIFNIWEGIFGVDSPRLHKVLGSFVGDKLLTELMLDNIQNTYGPNKVNSVAVAPYFFGCTVATQCPNAAHQLINTQTVDDVFATIDQPREIDVKSLDGTIKATEEQLTRTRLFNVDLITYEGGQHLVTGVFGSAISEAEKPRLRKLFHAVNRDPRMKDRYIIFLNAWKELADDGATLFTLYTMPQSFYRFGNFGIKEHLNMPRSESPKFDGAMTFQETQGECWWANCNP